MAIKDLTLADGKEMRRLFWNDNVTATDLAKRFNVNVSSTGQVLYNIFLYDPEFRFPPEKKHIKEVVDKLTKGGLSLNYITLIIRSLFDVRGKVCINSVRRWQGRVTSKELKEGRGN